MEKSAKPNKIQYPESILQDISAPFHPLQGLLLDTFSQGGVANETVMQRKLHGVESVVAVL